MAQKNSTAASLSGKLIYYLDLVKIFMEETYLFLTLKIPQILLTFMYLWMGLNLYYKSWYVSLCQHSNVQLTAKGQLRNFEMYFLVLQFSQKANEKIRLYCYGTSSQLFSFVFWENWRHQKYISKLSDLPSSRLKTCLQGIQGVLQAQMEQSRFFFHFYHFSLSLSGWKFTT